MEKAKNFYKIHSWIMLLTIIIAAGFALRLIFAFSASKIPFNFLSDSSLYYAWAKNIIAGKDFVTVYHCAPLYPFFLALIFSLSGPSIPTALIVQAVLGALSCLLVYYLSMK